ncbi:MAG TPA: TIGR02996 domain-containing protein [Gemmata sp.]
MTDADALLRGIIAHPADDTARLVYADWLQENGRGEEGEFIRTQCRLAAAAPDDPEYPALLERDEELRLWLHTHAPKPHPKFPAGLEVDGPKWWWLADRGFPRFLEYDGDTRQGAPAMRRLASALERAFKVIPTRWLVVRFITTAQLAALLKQPVLSGLSRLTVQLAVSLDEANDAARALAACPHLRNLRALLLYFPFSDPGCAALAGGPWGELEWFGSPCHEVSPAGLRALVGAAWFRNLRELKFSDGLPSGTFEELTGLPAFPRLHTLDLSHNLFSENSWQTFGRTRAFPALTCLELSSGDLSGSRLPALAGARGFSLRVLNANRCGTGPGTGPALAAAPWASALRVLDLRANGLDLANTKAVTASKTFTNLQHLDLSNNAIGAAGLSALAGNRALRGLRVLKLGAAPSTRGLTPTHFGQFLTKLDLPDLRHLDLSGHPVGANAAKKLADPKFTPLRRLMLNGCRLSDTAVAKLLAAPALQNLVQLGLDTNNLTTGPQALADPSTLPHLAACSLANNPIPAPVVRKLRPRAAVTDLPKTPRRT